MSVGIFAARETCASSALASTGSEATSAASSSESSSPSSSSCSSPGVSRSARSASSNATSSLVLAASSAAGSRAGGSTSSLPSLTSAFGSITAGSPTVSSPSSASMHAVLTVVPSRTRPSANSRLRIITCSCGLGAATDSRRRSSQGMCLDRMDLDHGPAGPVRGPPRLPGFARLALARRSLMPLRKEILMIASRYLFAALLASASLTACIDTGDDTLGEADEDLSTSSWSFGPRFNIADDLGNVPASAMLNGVQYYVYPFDDGGVLPGTSHDLYWNQCDAYV